MSIVEFKYKATAVVATCPVLAVRISWAWAIRLYVSHYPPIYDQQSFQEDEHCKPTTTTAVTLLCVGTSRTWTIG